MKAFSDQKMDRLADNIEISDSGASSAQEDDSIKLLPKNQNDNKSLMKKKLLKKKEKVASYMIKCIIFAV